MNRSVVVGLLFMAAVAPAVAGQSREGAAATEREFTLGLVQKEVRVGMSQADLATSLGSPNIVTRDSQGREAWIYDKIAAEARYKSSSVGGGGFGAFTPATSLLLGLLNGQRRSETSVTTQRTLTVVVRFDGEGRVESFAFHASRF